MSRIRSEFHGFTVGGIIYPTRFQPYFHPLEPFSVKEQKPRPFMVSVTWEQKVLSRSRYPNPSGACIAWPSIREWNGRGRERTTNFIWNALYWWCIIYSWWCGVVVFLVLVAWNNNGQGPDLIVYFCFINGRSPESGYRVLFAFCLQLNEWVTVITHGIKIPHQLLNWLSGYQQTCYEGIGVPQGGVVIWLGPPSDSMLNRVTGGYLVGPFFSGG